MKRYYCTYFDSHYLAKALSLFESLNQHEVCDFEIFAVCMDEYSRVLLNKLKIKNVTPLAMHEIERRDEALLKAKHERTKIEYYWTSTSTIILRLLERHPQIEYLTYVDADLYFYSSPQPIFDEWQNYSVLIHEHRFSADQQQSIVYGRFNVGLLSFKNDSQALTVLKNWRQQCLDWCFFRIEDNKIGDQKYLDEWPAKYSFVGIIQHIGAGLGPWNHIQYQYQADGNGSFSVNKLPGIFYHFHGFNIIQPGVIKPIGDVYQVNTDILKFCFLPYIESLSQQIVRLKEAASGFAFGISDVDAQSEIQQQRLLLVRQSELNTAEVNQELQTHAKQELSNDWSCCYLDMHANDDAEVAGSAEKAAESENCLSRLWPEGKPVQTPDDILHALRDRPITRRIRTLYIVGAFQFEERDLLFSLFPNLQSVYLFEPTPEAYESLKQIIANDHRVSVFPYAISNFNGQSEFNVSNNWQSSSLLNFGKHKEIFPEVDMTRAITVETRTIDQVIIDHILPPPDMLFADAQGAENQIIGSFSQNLRERLQLIYTEASTEELYVGSGTLDDLCNNLIDHFEYLGFAPTRNETPTHGNAIFVNKADMSFMGELEVSDVQKISPDKQVSAHQQFLELGERYANKGEYPQAIQVFEAAVEQYPSSAELLNNLGVSYFNLQDKSKALSSLSRAIQADPYHRNSVSNCAKILAEINEYELAKNVINAYLEKYADDKEMLVLYSCITEHDLQKWISQSEIVDANYVARNYKVTAIVSTYNSEGFMRECLDDLVSQTLAKDIEIIVLDACSQQNERAIVHDFQQQHDNIRYIRTSERIGIYLAWNIMSFMASAPYITSFSTNDRLRKDAYELLYSNINQHNYAIVYGDTYLTSQPHQSFEQNTATGQYVWPPYSRDALLQNCMVGPHPMWRKSIHQEIGYFDDSYDAIGDQEFWCRAALNYELYHLDEYTGLYWVTSDSLSGNSECSNREVARYRQKYSPYISSAA